MYHDGGGCEERPDRIFYVVDRTFGCDSAVNQVLELEVYTGDIYMQTDTCELATVNRDLPYYAFVADVDLAIFAEFTVDDR